MKVSFGKRLAAYIIDTILITMIISIIGYALPKHDTELEKSLNELSTKIIEGKIDTTEYMKEYKDILYKEHKKDIIINTVNVTITIAYFVVFQYMNKGQTIGKKLLKIKVVDKNTEEHVHFGQCLLRSIIITNIVSNIVSVTLIYILKKGAYTNTYMIITEIESILTFVSIILVLYRKDGRGAHDMIANTQVITEGRA